jgi:TrmH family RNA methyltransferase
LVFLNNLCNFVLGYAHRQNFIMELTNNIRKLIASLDKAAVRRREGLFVAEGTKCVADTCDFFDRQYVFATSAWVERNAALALKLNPVVVKPVDMERMSQLTTPSDILAVYHIPQYALKPEMLNNSLVLALDRVQDPGNLGTIIRVADWMGVDTIIASRDTVDVFNPKVVQATMGAIARVKVHYVDLPQFLLSLTDIPIYGTFLDGTNIYTTPLSPTGIVIMGNEGQGISPEVEKLVNAKILIPSYPPERPTSESLNVATATAITLAEFRRQLLK